MQSRFEDLTKKLLKEFGEASYKVNTASVPKHLKLVTDKDEMKRQYWEVDKIRSDLRYHKSSVERNLSEIQSLLGNSSEIRRLLTTSDETWEESLGKGVVDAAFGGGNRGVNWSVDARIQQAKWKLENLSKNYKDLPIKFDAPIKKLSKLLEPLESQLEWHEKSPLTDGAAKLASTVWNFGASLIPKKDKSES